MTFFLDLDGVLADFDLGYENLTGIKPTRWPHPDNINWNRIQAVPDFYLSLPLMPGAEMLFEATAALCERYGGQPTILTGIPASIDAADNNKRRWVARHFGENVPVICCRSRDKYLHGKPNDVLVDDYLKYRREWEHMGGVFIHYRDAAQAIDELTMLAT